MSQIDEAELSFAVNLWDKIPTVFKRIDDGLFQCKMVSDFLKRRQQIEEIYSNSLMDLYNDMVDYKVSSKKFRLSKPLSTKKMEQDSTTKNGTLANCWTEFLQNLKNVAVERGNYRWKLENEVLEPLQSFIDEYETHRRELTRSFDKCEKEIFNAYTDLKKAKASFDKFAGVESGKNSKDEKLQQRYLKQAAVMDSAESVYRTQLLATNSKQDKFYTIQLPLLLEGAEAVEKRRCRLLAGTMQTYVSRSDVLCSREKTELASLVEVSSRLDPNKDIHDFIANERNPFSVMPTPIPFYDCGVPVPDSVLKGPCLRTGRKSSKVDTSLPPGSQQEQDSRVFGLSVPQLMAREEETDVVPSILLALCDQLEKTDAFKQEGIFRISVSARELDELKAQMDTGTYDLSEIDDCYLVANLLKKWLREMASSLLPPHLYDKALEAGNDIAKVGEVVDAMDPYSRFTLSRVVQVLWDTHKHADVTKMTLENVTKILAPCVMRPISATTEELMVNADNERVFLESVCHYFARKMTASSASLVCCNSTQQMVSPPFSGPSSQSESEDIQCILDEGSDSEPTSKAECECEGDGLLTTPTPLQAEDASPEDQGDAHVVVLPRGLGADSVLHEELVTRYRGVHAYLDAQRDFIATCRAAGPGCEVLFLGDDDRRSSVHVNEIHSHVYAECDIPYKFLVATGNDFLLGPLEEYRHVDPTYFFSKDCVAIYDDKVMVFAEEEGNLEDYVLSKVEIMIIQHKGLADQFRRYFYNLWDNVAVPCVKSSTQQLFHRRMSPPASEDLGSKDQAGGISPQEVD
eukprot:GCRY01002598.1.p1 GENE.GCRY01002598.1~~GCRY01002598.1.p1  ORF type:complete len:803 (-),score=181.61 GCRY01002598.1:25-2433(-)